MATLYMRTSPDGALWSVDFGEFGWSISPAALDWSSLSPSQRRARLKADESRLLPDAVCVGVCGFLDIFERDYEHASPSSSDASSPSSETLSPS
jgi:hypothetical protein